MVTNVLLCHLCVVEDRPCGQKGKKMNPESVSFSQVKPHTRVSSKPTINESRKNEYGHRFRSCRHKRLQNRNNMSCGKLRRAEKRREKLTINEKNCGQLRSWNWNPRIFPFRSNQLQIGRSHV